MSNVIGGGGGGGSAGVSGSNIAKLKTFFSLAAKGSTADPISLPAPTPVAPKPIAVKAAPQPVKQTAVEVSEARRQRTKSILGRSSSRRSLIAGETGGAISTVKKTLLGV